MQNWIEKSCCDSGKSSKRGQKQTAANEHRNNLLHFSSVQCFTQQLTVNQIQCFLFPYISFFFPFIETFPCCFCPLSLPSVSNMMLRQAVKKVCSHHRIQLNIRISFFKAGKKHQKTGTVVHYTINQCEYFFSFLFSSVLVGASTVEVKERKVLLQLEGNSPI